MILLEVGNRILHDTVRQRIRAKRQETLDITLADFDGVLYHVSTPNPEQRNIVRVSLQWKCAQKLMSEGGQQDLQRIYGPLLTQPEQGYDISLQFDLNGLSDEDKQKLPQKVSLLKRHLLSAPFKKMFTLIEAKKANDSQILQIAYRDEEVIYLKPEGERCQVIFAVYFRDPDDQVLGKVFLQEFADARKTIRGAPSVAFTQKGEVPMELQGVPGVRAGDESIGYVTFVLFQQHINQRNAIRTINQVQLFRNYLHYHIKCAKGYLHRRMRDRVALLLQILNRARPQTGQPKEKKLMSGRTFVRK